LRQLFYEMPLTIRRIFLSVFYIGLSLQAFAQQTTPQTCGGSLGDPVINQDFGAGANPGPQLAPGITNMTYTSDNCPNDGYYTIANSLTGSGNCHPDTWHNVVTDHTGNPNGYMMIVNASEQPSVFFTQAANGLCPNTTYVFSSWILNLITLAASGQGVSEPNITFSIATTSGQVLAIDTTGTIPPTAGVSWYNYGVYFTTPANVTDVVVTMTNNAPGGNGNDLILDDITFRACGPKIVEGFSSTSGPKAQSLCQGANGSFDLTAQVVGNGTPAYQWQSNNTNAGWVDVAGANSSNYTAGFTNAQPGAYQYRLGVGNGSAISDVGCRVYSPPLTIYVNPLPVVPVIAGQTLCVGQTLQLTAAGGASYTWTGPGISPTSQNPLVINNVTLANSGTYSVVALSDSSCTSVPLPVQVTIVPKIVPVASSNVQAVCAGESVQLSASGGLHYKWTPSTGLSNDTIPNPAATPLQTTTYTVDISNAACSDSSQSVTVTVNQNPIADAGNEIILFEGQSGKLNGTIKGDAHRYPNG
jgi:hypothetical protein